MKKFTNDAVPITFKINFSLPTGDPQLNEAVEISRSPLSSTNGGSLCKLSETSVITPGTTPALLPLGPEAAVSNCAHLLLPNVTTALTATSENWSLPLSKP